MSYDKTLSWEYGQEVYLEYSLDSDELKLASWTLYKGSTQIVPDRNTSAEIEELVANWLEKEYSRNAYNYVQDLQDAMLEQRWER